MAEDFVTLGDKSVETSNFDRYKGRKGEVDRVGFISSSLMRGYSYYYEAKKMSFRAPTNPETLKFVKEQLGAPTQYFGLTLFHYQTDEDGQLLVEEKLQGKVKTWKISESRYEELSSMHRQWPLLDAGPDEPQVDLVIKCSEEQYQRMTFSPTPKAHWKSKSSWYEALKKKEILSKEKLKLALGPIRSDEEILSILGGTLKSQTGGTENAGDIDLSDIIDD